MAWVMNTDVFYENMAYFNYLNKISTDGRQFLTVYIGKIEIADGPLPVW